MESVISGQVNLMQKSYAKKLDIFFLKPQTLDLSFQIAYVVKRFLKSEYTIYCVVYLST